MDVDIIARGMAASGGGGGTTYTGGDGVSIANNVITTKIDDDVMHYDSDGNISATQMTGATASANGTAGIVPAPTIAQRTKFMCGNGTWVEPGIYKIADEWDSTVTYSIGQCCLKDGALYRAIVANTNQVPPNATYWENVMIATSFGITSGYTANGSYVKLPDGTLIQYGILQGTAAFTTAWSSAGYYGSLTETASFPIAFTTTPIVGFSPITGNSAAVISYTATTSGISTINGWRADANTAAYALCWTAIGRWK